MRPQPQLQTAMAWDYIHEMQAINPEPEPLPQNSSLTENINSMVSMDTLKDIVSQKELVTTKIPDGKYSTYELIETAKAFTALLISQGYDRIENLPITHKKQLGRISQQVIRLLSMRIGEYRSEELELSNNSNTKQLKYNWKRGRNDKALRRLQMKKAKALKYVDEFCYIASCCNGTDALFVPGTQEVDLGRQRNFAPMEDAPGVGTVERRGHGKQYHPVKQLSPEWRELRETVRLTGSTMHRALGLT